jgi:hypothetical protein
MAIAEEINIFAAMSKVNYHSQKWEYNLHYDHRTDECISRDTLGDPEKMVEIRNGKRPSS